MAPGSGVTQFPCGAVNTAYATMTGVPLNRGIDRGLCCSFGARGGNNEQQCAGQPSAGGGINTQGYWMAGGPVTGNGFLYENWIDSTGAYGPLYAGGFPAWVEAAEY